MNGPFTYPSLPWMSIADIKDSCNQFKSNKSAGPDGFKPFILKRLPDIAYEKLLQLYEASYHSGYVPSEWLKAIVVFFQKPGKDNYALPIFLGEGLGEVGV